MLSLHRLQAGVRLLHCPLRLLVVFLRVSVGDLVILRLYLAENCLLFADPVPHRSENILLLVVYVTVLAFVIRLRPFVDGHIPMVVLPPLEVLFTEGSMHLWGEFRTLLQAFIEVFESALLSRTIGSH